MSDYRLLQLPQKIVEVTSVTAADLDMIRDYQKESKAICPTCKEPMKMTINNEGVLLEHQENNPYPNHQADDRESLASKRLLVRHLMMLLPQHGKNIQTWEIRSNVPVLEAGLVAPVLAVSDLGARLVVEIIQDEIALSDILTRTEQWSKSGVRALWLIDGRRAHFNQDLVENINLKEAETALVCCELPLLYFVPQQLSVYLVLPIPEAVELAGLGDISLGVTPCLVRRFPLSQLGLRSGDWFLPARFNAPAPLPPPLSLEASSRLKKLRGGAQL